MIFVLLSRVRLTVVFARHGKLVVLISYAAMEDSSMSLDVPSVRRIYALTRLFCLGETFRVDNVSSVPYQSVSRSILQANRLCS
jgi:nuclear pore complex protein Nup133